MARHRSLLGVLALLALQISVEATIIPSPDNAAYVTCFGRVVASSSARNIPHLQYEVCIGAIIAIGVVMIAVGESLHLATTTTTTTTTTTAAVTTREVFICESTALSLRCPSGTTLTILSANFGRTDSTNCQDGTPAHVANTNCAFSVTALIGTWCNGLQSCFTPTTNLATYGIAADPCPGTFKYTDIKFTCS